MSDSTIGYGSVVSIADTEAGTYVPIAQLRDITPPAVTREEDDTSHMSSPDRFKETDPGWLTADNASFDLLFTKAQYATVYALAVSGAKKWFKVIDSAGNAEKFEGFVLKVSRAIPLEGRVTASVEIKATKLPTYTPAA